MRYVVASLFGALLLFGFIALAGAGHGWIAGAFSCLPLAAVSFAAWLNALRTVPSLNVANGLLVTPCVVLVGTAYGTLSEGTGYFLGYWRLQGPLTGSIIALIYFNWIFAYGFSWWRRRASSSIGT
ncbi:MULTISPECIES: hypothetical protein [Mesorhizobium]|uniref:Uncharacterized protein n=1 Tax=Mesorhizobium opportunistum (strain LMG 24607 / HAMBI 3007 / WSM2075) TaxID=536019 RepID=F7Y5Q8_MESOW|nr:MULTISPECIES: hypothetical protein [Mesorhizobium]AEH87383.1 hypothetical protein Mesop_2926 [Mesorhizobium opportunistum WSM2075]TPN53224.1 hypothetical protein FJ978_10630 [Mesorhizobium sp. B1-1-7]